MCNGFKEPVDVHEFGLTKKAMRCVSCGQYDFLEENQPEVAKCFRHQVKYCGICERVQRRKDDKIVE